MGWERGGKGREGGIEGEGWAGRQDHQQSLIWAQTGLRGLTSPALHNWVTDWGREGRTGGGENRGGGRGSPHVVSCSQGGHRAGRVPAVALQAQSHVTVTRPLSPDHSHNLYTSQSPVASSGG